jgi:glutaredoxin
MAETTIVMVYTHKGCPGGDAARQYLDAHRVPYEVRDVINEEAARDEFRRLGGIGTPLLLIGQLVMHGFDPDEFERLATLFGERGAARG